MVGLQKKKKKETSAFVMFFRFFMNLPPNKNRRGHFDISDLLQSKIPKKISHMRMSQ